MKVKFNDSIAHFLSRLCGGEDGDIDGLVQVAFLSRLCGGEAYAREILLGVVFLSRLCGGEG